MTEKEKEAFLTNPNLIGFRKCSYCNRYFEDGKYHSCYAERTMEWTNHGKRRRKNRQWRADNNIYVTKDKNGKL